ncbi:Protein of unknown function [Cotesia congregata]|uniref:Endonuclease/exonuclease/phosphatase domain-containing protein n=1 Tax=Cotesia congregata TaxID=51543 RepID=A0A8J2H6G2_COTCN|nr:Protein of unknown function [Cotesia congregata]
MIISVYNNVGIKKIESELKGVVEENARTAEKIIIVGDLNARVGERNTEGVKEEGRLKRKSKDKVFNSEGKKLLKVCKELGLRIMNGGTEGDRKGEITFIGGKSENCGSVLDLVLTLDRGGDSGISYLKILKSIDSDHLPLILNLNEKDKAKAGAKRQGSESDHIAQEEGAIKIEEDILGWKKDKIAEYQEVIWEKWNEKITERETELEWNDMKEIIYNGAKETGMSKKRKECDKADKTKKEWFNNECKLKREEVWKALKKLTNEKDSNNKS